MEHLDIIVPAFNEAENLPLLLGRINASLHTAKISYRVIIVDDRSSDTTIAVAQKLSKKFPILVVPKKGPQGKAFSILEGAKHAKGTFIVMIDADVQYPPEVIPAMLQKAIDEKHGVVVAHRRVYGGSLLRRVGSRALQFLFGRLLFGFTCDMQSGLKLFRRSLLNSMDTSQMSPWALDVPLLKAAVDLGWQIGEVDITFEERKHGSSKLSLLKPTIQIGTEAVKLRFTSIKPQPIAPSTTGSMIGAGVEHKQKRFITHTTLGSQQSALTTFTNHQKFFIGLLLVTLLLGLILSPLATAIIVVAILSFIYFIDVVFNFFLILKSLHSPPELTSTKREIAQVEDKDLPIYTILCPLYREAHVIPAFIDSISKLDWPKKKLDVQLLLEEDDTESIEAVKHMKLPSHVRMVVVPHSLPKTKPKACNYGLSLAKGEYVVIFDAEDVPAPDQLKKAYLAFQKVGPNVKCLQAKLNYYNPHQNWLTRFFTAEYSLWFDVILTGLQSIETTIPLGGTSNHFRTQDLLDLQGWDPFNVTEDCDLGVRLFKNGYQTAIIDSTTLEEANGNVKNWIRQRSRWIKGYMQTYLVHMRDPIEFGKEQGIHALLFQLTVGGKLAFILINPFLWVLTIAYFTLYRFVGPSIEAVYPSIVFYMAVTSLIFGNFMFIYYYMIGCAKREHWGLIKWVYLIPIYWLLVSIAGAMALYQLITNPHYWEKTIHGLHLKKNTSKKVPKKTTAIPAGIQTLMQRVKKEKWTKKLNDPVFRSSFIYVLAMILSNVINFVGTTFLGGELKFSDFGYMNLFLSFIYISSLALSAYSATINYKISYLLGKYGEPTANSFWKWVRAKTLLVSIALSLGWITIIPFLVRFFHTPNSLPFVLFVPVIIIGALSTVDKSLIKGRLEFQTIALLTVIEPIVRLVLTYIFAESNHINLLYLAIPLSMIITFAIGYWYAKRNAVIDNNEHRFSVPPRFFMLSLLGGISGIAFFSLDNILISHFLDARQVGMYGILGVLGKMIFFIGSLTLGLLLPLVSHNEGKNVSSKKIFTTLFVLITLMSVAGYLCFGIGISLVGTHFFGEKITSIIPYLPWYGLGVMFFTISQTYVTYHLAKNHYVFPITAFLITVGEVVLLSLFHRDLRDVVAVMTIVGFVNIMLLTALHFWYLKLTSVFNNAWDFIGLFRHLRKPKNESSSNAQLRILIFAWRDIRHIWAGGSELYIHEIAKRLSDSGMRITLFCGNDGRNPRNEVIDGVQIVRRGGFYTVYFWAFLYYVLKFRNCFDVVIDIENGIPFLTPFFVRKPIFLLIHHIHQDVFREHLPGPLAKIALFVEAELMPFLYRDKKIITVSESSKGEIISLGLGTKESIDVINPGINDGQYKKSKKTSNPSLAYVGRLKPYKHVETAIAAFEKVLGKYPSATFTIAGSGESEHILKKLVVDRHLDKNITFLGKVSEEEKNEILGSAWLVIQPSSIEGWGITVIEANACGTPVIASNVKGLRDSVIDGKTGMLVPTYDTMAFATTICDFFGDTKKRSLFSQNAYTWSKKFSWDNSAKQFSHITEGEMMKPKQYEYAVEQ